MAVSKITTPPTQKEAIDKINEIIDNMGGTITVDQTYDGTSVNPQSGVAIAGAKFLQNTATGTNSLTIEGTPVSSSNSVNIGASSSIGEGSCVAIGYYARTVYSGATAIGASSYASSQWSTAIGRASEVSGNLATAIGAHAVASAGTAIQIGWGTNSIENTLQIGFNGTSYQLLDGTTGLIPDARISTNIARSSDIPTIDQTFDKTSANAQSGASILGLLETIYPVGALYIGTTSTCPLASLFGTWTLVAQDKALWTGDGTNADTTIPATIPNIKGSAEIGGVSGASWTLAGSGYTGAFSSSGVGIGSYATQTTSYANVGISIDASRYNSIYSDSATTVQPPAYVVNVWKRTA